ncbi:MAG TPA: AbrB/MazE/SpoVT family DNA-binding domain-containing protein [Terriglobia bacterium]|jgi:AbrB family looped-hinge helix DNA binding protein|nr:AbrB/MazE/SpoVT family DNA-binding domain-containing protein [Terriglobia bacterium]
MASQSKVYPVRVGRQGRLIIPAPLRKEMGLRPGDTLLCGATKDRLVLTVRNAAERELWARFAGVRGSLAKELIRERRKEARREG